MNRFPEITIAGFQDLESLAGTAFTKVISIHDANEKESGRFEEKVRAYFPRAHVVFGYFTDKVNPVPEAPTERDIELLLQSSSTFTPEDKVLIHCRAGVSRSPAVGYAIVCQHTDPGQEEEALDYMESVRPLLVPNRLIVQFADKILNREGKMLAAWHAKFQGF